MTREGSKCVKVYKSLKLNKNPASRLAGARPLGTVAFFLFVSSIPVQAVSLQETTAPRTFADWCLNKNNLSVETVRTINVLLEHAGTTDCNQASKILSALPALYTREKLTDLRPLSTLTSLSKLWLGNNQIADIKPLLTLTNLKELYLDNNQISDIKPLSTLTNLYFLWLNNNQISNIKPLSTLTNLGGLWLNSNQISDVKPLSTLTNLGGSLGGLYLDNNPLVDRTCPVKPKPTDIPVRLLFSLSENLCHF